MSRRKRNIWNCLCRTRRMGPEHLLTSVSALVLLLSRGPGWGHPQQTSCAQGAEAGWATSSLTGPQWPRDMDGREASTSREQSVWGFAETFAYYPLGLAKS